MKKNITARIAFIVTFLSFVFANEMHAETDESTFSFGAVAFGNFDLASAKSAISSSTLTTLEPNLCLGGGGEGFCTYYINKSIGINLGIGYKYGKICFTNVFFADRHANRHDSNKSGKSMSDKIAASYGSLFIKAGPVLDIFGYDRSDLRLPLAIYFIASINSSMQIDQYENSSNLNASQSPAAKTSFGAEISAGIGYKWAIFGGSYSFMTSPFSNEKSSNFMKLFTKDPEILIPVGIKIYFGCDISYFTSN